MSDDNAILEKWNEIKKLFENLDLDVAKNSKGNAAAGVRVRKGLRLLETASKDLRKFSLETDKERKTSKE